MVHSTSTTSATATPTTTEKLRQLGAELKQYHDDVPCDRLFASSAIFGEGVGSRVYGITKSCLESEPYQILKVATCRYMRGLQVFTRLRREHHETDTKKGDDQDHIDARYNP